MTDEATQVTPNCSKLDLERFYQDLPKYMPYLSLLAREHWEQFQSANPTTLSNTNLMKWDLPTLYSAAICSPQLQANDQISHETSSLLQKEVATPKRVSEMCYVV